MACEKIMTSLQANDTATQGRREQTPIAPIFIFIQFSFSEPQNYIHTNLWDPTENENR